MQTNAITIDKRIYWIPEEMSESEAEVHIREALVKDDEEILQKLLVSQEELERAENKRSF